jgi:hypothetical protein
MYYPVVKTSTSGLTGTWAKVAGFVVASSLDNGYLNSVQASVSSHCFISFEFTRFFPFLSLYIYISVLDLHLYAIPLIPLLVASPGQVQFVLAGAYVY